MHGPDILLVGGLMPMIVDQLSTRFTLHRLPESWEGAPPEAHAPEIRAIAAAGHAAIGKTLLDRYPNLELLAKFGVGYETVDVHSAASRGIVVTNTPDVLTEEVADLAVGLLIATLRQIPQADRYARSGKWLDRSFPLTASLRDRTVGILGLGRIGKALARRLQGFGVDLVYHGRSRQAGVSYPFYASLSDMARDVDVLVSTAPGGPGTDGLVDKQVLDALGPDGVFINIGRGTVVDQPALIEALTEKRILSAGLDVFADEPHIPPELTAMDNVVLLPHVGSGSVHTRNAMGQLLVDNVFAWFEGRGPLTPVAETPVKAPGSGSVP